MYPALMQRVTDYVKPERMEKKRENHRKKWWIYAEPRSVLRKAMVGIPRYIGTCYTAKHRPFVMLDEITLPDDGIVAFALYDYYHLGVLSSTIHQTWVLEAGGMLEDRPRYNHSECFNKFPFPACQTDQQEKIRTLGEQLDAHRKRQQALHPALTLTGMYNVLEAVRAGQPLSAKERTVYEQGLVGILKELHDQLDAAVAEAYGWTDLSGVRPSTAEDDTEQILERLVALNAERAAEEARGLVRWLRPEYQAKGEAVQQAAQGELDVDEEAPPPAPAEALPWPKELPAQAAALSTVLAALPAPATVAGIATHFAGKATKKRLDEIARLLETLEALGRASHIQGDRWLAAR